MKTLTQTFTRRVLSRLRQLAIDGHKQYPQYVNYFDDWQLASILQAPGQYKSGAVFGRGQYVLANFNRSVEYGDVYDPTLNIVCSMHRNCLQFITRGSE